MWQYCNWNIFFQDDVDRLLEDGSLDDNVESFLSQDDMDPRDSLGRCMDASKGVFFIPSGTWFDFNLSLREWAIIHNLNIILIIVFYYVILIPFFFKCIAFVLLWKTFVVHLFTG